METSAENICFQPEERDRITLISAGVPLTKPKCVFDCGYINAICFSPANNDLIAICGSAEFVLWDIKSNTPLIRKKTHENTSQVNFSFDGRYASISGPKLFIFDINDQCLKWKDEADIFNDVAWHPKKPRLYFYNDVSIYMSELPLKPVVLYKEENVGENILKMIISKNGRFLISSTSDCSIRILDTETNEIMHKIQQPNKPAYGIYRICASETFAIFQYYACLEVFSFKSGKLQATLISMNSYKFDQIYQIEFLEKEHVFALTSYDGWIIVVDLSTLTMRNYTFDTEIFGPTVSFPYFEMFFNKSKDNLIRIFDPDSKKVIKRYQPSDPPGDELMIAPDRKRFVNYKCAGLVDVFDME